MRDSLYGYVMFVLYLGKKLNVDLCNLKVLLCTIHSVPTSAFELTVWC